MDFNNEETPKLNLKKDKKMNNTNLLPVGILTCISIALVIFVIFMMVYNPSDSYSTKVEISLNVNDVKVDDNLTCESSKDAAKDAQNVKLSYKKSEDKFYYGDESKLIVDGEYKEPKEEEKRNGVDLVIDNITKNIYVYVEYSYSDSDADGLKYTYSDSKDGKITIPFSSYDKSSASIYVYDANENCNKILKHYDVELPRYNILSEDKRCDSDDGKESKYCAPYTYDKFDENVLNNLKSGKTEESVFDIKSIAVVFVLFIGAAVVIYIKLR